MKTILVVLILVAIAALCFVFQFDCPVCAGTGKLEGTRSVSSSCRACGGKGKVDRKTLKGNGSAKTLGGGKDAAVCLRCRGTGRVTTDVPKGACGDCRGRGHMNVVRWVQVGRPEPQP